MSKTIGIFFSPWPKDYRYDRDRIKVSFLKLVDMYKKGLALKAMPREEAYMKNLFGKHFPEGDFLRVENGQASPLQMADASKIVLLYPDSIGHGFRRIEDSLPSACGDVFVLNGRGRLFPLDSKTRRALRCRRIIESLLILEIISAAIFVAATPFLLVWDILRGRT